MGKNTTLGGVLRQLPFMVVMLAAFVFSAGNGLRALADEGVANGSQQLEQEQKDDDRPVAYLDYACDAIAPVAQLLFFQATFQAPLPVIQVWKKTIEFIPSPRGSDPYFRILFRSIISPNAP